MNILPGCHGCPQVGHQVDDGSLAAVVRQVGMVPHVQDVEHNRPGTEVEGHVLTDGGARVALDRQVQPPLLDARHADDLAVDGELYPLRVGPQGAGMDDAGQVADVREVVNLRPGLSCFGGTHASRPWPLGSIQWAWQPPSWEWTTRRTW